MKFLHRVTRNRVHKNCDIMNSDNKLENFTALMRMYSRIAESRALDIDEINDKIMKIPDGISSIFGNNIHGIWIIFLSFTHFLAITVMKTKHIKNQSQKYCI